ncbi:MAG: response regulator [Chloroflexales bacterium]|jgi:two-component system, cell cycle response regulator DivK
MAHILLVEDDKPIREMLESYFMRSGFDVITAEDGVQALLLGRSTQPDVIVMDMGLPKLNGWQATQRLRARAETAQIPIIALTAYVMDEDRKRALNIGCDAFEPKPINLVSLLDTIHRLLLSR